jgi:hypothetical protein
MNSTMIIPPQAASAQRPTSDDVLLATRAELEVRFGVWCTEPVLCEDGRATRLAILPDGGHLYLTRDGELLVVHAATGVGGLWHAAHFHGHPDWMWSELQQRCLETVPGCLCLPRFWPIQDPPGPATTGIWGVFDLRALTVVEWIGARDEALGRVTEYEGRMLRSSLPLL